MIEILCAFGFGYLCGMTATVVAVGNFAKSGWRQKRDET